jgi:hemolysin III
MNVIDESLPLPIWTQSAGEEVANGISHGDRAGGCDDRHADSASGSIAPWQHPFSHWYDRLRHDDAARVPGSTLYHCWLRTHTKSLLQVLDHSAIFLLIAGTYTPFALGALLGDGGLAMLGIVWALALFGVIMKATRGMLRHRETCDDSLPWNGLDRTHL